ncbi:MAG: nucleotidyltransferase domain-containing protein [Candidatus Magnetoovum sp. WYHC-5]|nr:nucleotidyltransferase domain-containing protein [Candidatus Magnetoovum sp. WYHC-5]
MIESTYIEFLQKAIRRYFPDKDIQAFIFGSAVQKKRFRDVDIALIGELDRAKLYDLKEALEESNFPYIVDIVTIDSTTEEFKGHILEGEKIFL